MIRRSFAIAIALVVTLGASPSRAHEEYRFVGTIVKVEKAQAALAAVSVKFKWEPKDTEELVAVVYIRNNTAITRNGQKVAVSELKVGLSVVVDALGDDWNHSDAFAVRIVPPLAK